MSNKSPGEGAEECSAPKKIGECAEKLARWSFSASDNKCVPFYYTGCEGNKNNYQTEDECQTSCPAEKGVVLIGCCMRCPLIPVESRLIPF